MLLIDVHKLDIILADTIGRRALKDQVDNIRRILRFQGQNVVALRGLEHLGERNEVHAEGNVAVAAVRRETFGLEHHGDESDMGVVHGLEGNAGVIAIEVAVLHEIFDCFDDLRRRGISLDGL